MRADTNIKSYRGVYFKITDSDICTLRYGMYFYFCSEAMKINFEKNLDSYIEKYKEKLERILPNTGIINIEMCLAIEYYIYIEKRGFRIETLNGVNIIKGHLISDVEFREDLKALEEKEK